MRNLHPAVDSFVKTGLPLHDICEPLKKAEPAPIIEAICLLYDFIEGRQAANGAFLAARNVVIQGHDTDLCILFLGVWANAFLAQSTGIPDKLSEAWSLIHRAKAFISDETPREITSFIEMVNARLFASEGNIMKMDACTARALANLPAKSQRRISLLVELASLLAQSGRLDEINKELARTSPGPANSYYGDQLTISRFVNLTETCRLQQAIDLLPSIPDFGNDIFSSNCLRKCRILLNLIAESMNRNSTQDKSLEIFTDLPDWALSLKCLILNSPNQALKWARICEKNLSSAVTGRDLISYNLIRAELATHNSTAAMHLLDLRKQKGNIHYLDDLFYARIHLLNGNIDAATERFKSVLEAAESRNSGARLDFELTLATEVPRNSILALTRSATRKTSVRHDVTSRPSPSPPNPKAEPTGVERIIGTSKVAENLRNTILQFSRLETPVLITGETGTGKELVARALHEESARSSSPFVAVNCASISESLLESELFGHEKGAFTGASSSHQGLFEEAGEGTILLDEIGEIPSRIQISLLRVLETMEIRPVGSSRPRKIKCRILAATNADLRKLAETGLFRKDILFRLQRLEIHIPPLSRRPDDILPLALHFLNQNRLPETYAMMSDPLCRFLINCAWPGNVRELRNTIEKLRLMNSDKLHYDTGDLEPLTAVPEEDFLRTAQLAPPSPVSSPQPVPHPEFMETAAQAGILSAVLRKGRSKIRRMETLRNLFRQHRVLTRAEIVKTLDISPNTASHDLQGLIDEGFIRKIQPTASPRSTHFSICDTHTS